MDFSSWQGVLSTILGIAVFALVGVGIRVLMMLTLQQRQQRMNRQINERLKTLIAAYRTLGGSFTGELTVSPAHLRDLRIAAAVPNPEDPAVQSAPDLAAEPAIGSSAASDGSPSERPRRIRDAVEAALSDILLLGTEEHVRLAGKAASDLAAGRPIKTAELVISLRTFIRMALDLEPIPENAGIPFQGPTRPQGGGGRGRTEGSRDRAGQGSGGGAGGGGAGGGGGTGIGMGGGSTSDPAPPQA